MRPRAKRTQHRRNESLRPRLIAGVQGRWAGASHSRVIPHTATAWCHITFSERAQQTVGHTSDDPTLRVIFLEPGDVRDGGLGVNRIGRILKRGLQPC
jgi:hypothetical protein